MIRIALAALVLSVGVAHAQVRESTLCEDAPPDNSAITRLSNGAVLLDWHDTVCREHADRVRRLLRLTEVMAPEERPNFSEVLIDHRFLPPEFVSDMPLLRIVFPEHSFFDTASTSIRPEAMMALALIAASLRKEVPDVAVFVAGHTDDRGGDDYNYNLSVDRATAVTKQLMELGVGGVALWRVGFGKILPLVPNDSVGNMALNRRVEFIIGARTEAVTTWLEDQNPTGQSICVGQLNGQDCRRHISIPIDAVAVTRNTGLIDQSKAKTELLTGTSHKIYLSDSPHITLNLTTHQQRIPALNPL